MGHQSEQSKARQQFIVDQDQQLDSKSKQLELIFLGIIIQFITFQIEQEAGKLRPSIRNYTKAHRISEILTPTFLEAGAAEFLHWMAGNYQRIFTLNIAYFSNVVERDIQSIADRIWRSYFQRIGYDYDNRSFFDGAYLLSLVAIPATMEAVRRLIVRAIQIGEAVSDLATALKDLVLRPGKKRGRVQEEILETSGDTFSNFDRDTGMMMSDELELNFAIYQGGIIKTTREFCYVRNDLVFTRDQIAKFGSPADPFGGYVDKSIGYFAGKSDPYDPFRDLGGYNCRHMLDWISDELAQQLLGEQRSDDVVLG